MKRFLFLMVMTATLSCRAHAAESLQTLRSLTQATLTPVAVPVGSQVMLGDKRVPVTPQGVALLAVGQFDTAPVTLRVTSPDGTTTRRLPVQRRSWQVQKITGLPQNMVSPPPALQQRINTENAQLARLRLRYTEMAGFLGGFQAPATGRISGVFGSHRVLNGQPRNAHRGVDFAGPVGAPVMAAGNGRVILAAPDMYLTGQTVLIDHGYTLATVYVHLSETLVREGQTVTKGQLIGRIGATGRATGPHLHWGATLGDVHLDPLTLLQAKF